MKIPSHSLPLTAALLALSTGCSSTSTSKAKATPVAPDPAFAVTTIERKLDANPTTPQFVSADILPGKGMNVYQIRAFVPGHGVVELLASPPVADFQKTFTDDKDAWGNHAFFVGGAILAPYANRIRGQQVPGKELIEAKLGDQTVQIPANWGRGPKDSEKHSIHGLIYNAAFTDLKRDGAADRAGVSATLNAGDFNGQWPSTLKFDVVQKLERNRFQLIVRATNTGKRPTPVGIGWHPYFRILSGQREQAKLFVPATSRTEMNNYVDTFPTGRLVALKGSDFDFAQKGGRALGKQFLDDGFVGLQRQKGLATVELVDPAAKYGIRVRAVSPQIKAFQVYAPTGKGKDFVAVEPQFNYGDPYSKIWGEGRKRVDTGMVTLKPGDSVEYRAELELFVP